MQIDETVHGCPVGRRCGSPDRQVGDPGSPSQIRTTSGQPPLVAAGRLRYDEAGRKTDDREPDDGVGRDADGSGMAAMRALAFLLTPHPNSMRYVAPHNNH